MRKLRLTDPGSGWSPARSHPCEASGSISSLLELFPILTIMGGWAGLQSSARVISWDEQELVGWKEGDHEVKFYSPSSLPGEQWRPGGRIEELKAGQAPPGQGQAFFWLISLLSPE